MSNKLSINEEKILRVLNKNNIISQADLFEKFEGEYSSTSSKRACISVALKKLRLKKMIKLNKVIKNNSRIPENVWELVK